MKLKIFYNGLPQENENRKKRGETVQMGFSFVLMLQDFHYVITPEVKTKQNKFVDPYHNFICHHYGKIAGKEVFTS